ncbi:hypothetical protein [Paenibacillus silviterrae]|uniref:hypothetical protein n=1 Tax=Paenibacillus silviterrae TaxID=3242194 RepID=UPI002542B307|nr:hypothetical protein [Paenibacillus chinjuensis]
MRKRLEEFKNELISVNCLEGHEDVLLAFDHLMDEVEKHEQTHYERRGLSAEAGYKAVQEAEETFLEEIAWFRQAAYRVIERTVADLVNKGNKHWTKFYAKVE